MDVPTKYVFHGPRKECEALYGQARRVMHVLESMMHLGGLKQQTLKCVPYPGALVVASKSFGAMVVNIYVGGGQIESPSQPAYKCLCFPHFSLAIISEIHVTLNPDGTPANDRATFRYVADVCTGKGYIEKRYVSSAGWEQYYVDQFVLVSIGEGVEDPEYPILDCDRFCLMSNPPFKSLVATPIHGTDLMKKWILKALVDNG